MTSQYKTIKQPAEELIIEKKSEFIGQIFPVEDISEVHEIQEALRVKHKTANHNCYAYVLGVKGNYLGLSDDGEPSGTAGRPILAVLQGEKLTNVLLIVTRYFGGTLLGTGGLVRAYTAAAKAALEAAEIVTKIYGIQLEIIISYPDLQKVQYAFEQQGIPIIESGFSDVVTLKVEIPTTKQAELEKTISTITKGAGKINELVFRWI